MNARTALPAAAGVVAGAAEAPGEITEVRLLGHAGKIVFARDADGLKISFPPKPPGEHAYVFAISGLGLN